MAALTIKSSYVTKHFNNVEEVLADEDFLAWFYQTDQQQATGWRQWLAQNPDQQPVVEEAIHFLQNVQLQEREVPEQQAQQAYHQLQQKLEENKAPVVPMKKSGRWWLPSVAAVAILALGFILWRNNTTGNKTKVESNYGQMSLYKLPDGSNVLLNAHSALTLNKEWKTGTDREVWVQGEAFFYVQKTPAHNKFVVHAKGADIIVTGTQFNVINTEKETSVLLTEGSVTIKTEDGKEVKMKPGDFVSIEKNTPEKKVVNEEQVLAWKQKKLEFDSTSITRVAEIIEAHYGIPVTVTKEVQDKNVSGVMSNNNLDVLLKALEFTNNFKITKTDKEIIISKP